MIDDPSHKQRTDGLFLDSVRLIGLSDLWGSDRHQSTAVSQLYSGDTVAVS